MARKTSRRVAAPKRRKSPTSKRRKSPAARQTSGATARSASAGARKAVSVKDFVRCIRTLHDLGLVRSFVRSANRAGLKLTMNKAALERVKNSVNRLRPPAPAASASRSRAGNESTGSVRRFRSNDPFDFGSNSSGGLGGVRPLPHQDPFDF